jgi:hypothetical protein
MRRLKGKLTYANVISTLCLFLLLGGGAAFAATKLKLGKNSVGTKQIKNGAVTGIKIKKGTISGTNINLGTLGTVPSANTAATAGTANALAPMEPTRIVGASGQPPFLDGTNNYSFGPFKFPPAGFYKDHDGIVHLNGLVKTGSGESPVPGLVFQLPTGSRPASGSEEVFVSEESAVFVFGSNVVIEGIELSGDVWVESGKEKVGALSGITFRAES